MDINEYFAEQEKVAREYKLVMNKRQADSLISAITAVALVSQDADLAAILGQLTLERKRIYE